MTKIGLYLKKRSTNLSEVGRKTGLTKARMGMLANNPLARLTAEELYLIALAIDVDPCELFKEIFAGLTLPHAAGQ